METFYKKIGLKIKKLREKTNLSQESLATQLGISRVAISQIEAGNRKISAQELVKLAETFNMTTDVLLDVKKDIKVIFETATQKPKQNLDE